MEVQPLFNKQVLFNITAAMRSSAVQWQYRSISWTNHRSKGVTIWELLLPKGDIQYCIYWCNGSCGSLVGYAVISGFIYRFSLALLGLTDCHKECSFPIVIKSLPLMKRRQGKMRGGSAYFFKSLQIVKDYQSHLLGYEKSGILGLLLPPEMLLLHSAKAEELNPKSFNTIFWDLPSNRAEAPIRIFCTFCI